MSQEDRWNLDLDLLNEVIMREHNSRRFAPPGSMEKRAIWFESTAHRYVLADLLQQIFDFRTAQTRNDEGAFVRLVELGQRGDISAKCFAATIYRHHEKEVTQRWRYSFEYVLREALKVKDSGHPACLGLEGALFAEGDFGYPKDSKRARLSMSKAAEVGSYGHQMALARMHQPGVLRLSPAHVALDLCWRRIADQHSTLSGFAEQCESYRFGIALDEKLNRVPLPSQVQRLAAEWCEPSRKVSAPTCAVLEEQLEDEE